MAFQPEAAQVDDFAAFDHSGTDIYRMKGVLAMQGCDDKYVYQGVHMLFTGEVLAAWSNSSPCSPRVVALLRPAVAMPPAHTGLMRGSLAVAANPGARAMGRQAEGEPAHLHWQKPQPRRA